MQFRISDTFTDCLARPAGDEQKAEKTKCFDLQLNSASPDNSTHQLDHQRDSNFWSGRVSKNLRAVVRRSDGNLPLCYVDHHDKGLGSHRDLETHPQSGAALVPVC